MEKKDLNEYRAELELKQSVLLEKQKKLELIEGLPHLYGWKWYGWALDFFESRSKQNLLCAANQISKSSTQIRKCIEWAGNTNLWTSLWATKPNQFWYLYPTADVATAEFETKWSQFMPKGAYKDHPTYGWEAVYDKKNIKMVRFNSGVVVYFKTYSQDVSHLQSGTVYALFCDEELPEELYDELMFRLTAADGYFHMVFTATLGQDLWRRALEPGSGEEEMFPYAWKRQVSMYECLKYTDGSESHWTLDKIKQIELRCKSKEEILRRVWGKFIRDTGRKYPCFDLGRHFKKPHPLPAQWLVHAGIDIGSGGKDGHPSAILFLAVAPDYRSARVIKAWRGDGIITTAGDVLNKYLEMAKELNRPIISAFYDWASKDFMTISQRSGVPFIAADKSHERGEEVLNTLFKNDMLFLYEEDEIRKLGVELHNVSLDTAKRKAKDDLCDALRYAATRLPWDFTCLPGHLTMPPDKTDEQLTPKQLEIKQRREAFETKQTEDPWNIQDEFSEWNSQYGGG